MSFRAKRELLVQVAPRYGAARHGQRSVILDEFVAVTGYERKYAIRLLLGPIRPPQPIRRPRVPRYGREVQEALATAWTAANGICGKRLVPFLPELIPTLERLRAAGLVDEELTTSALTYGLHHPLFQEVAYAEMGELRGRRSHAVYISALEQRCSSDLARLTRHYRAALPLVDVERAIDVLIEAGRQALGVWASREATRLPGAALELVQQRHRQDLLPVLLEELGTAWERVGETAAAVAMWTEAVALLERTDSREAVARVRRALAMAEY